MDKRKKGSKSRSKIRTASPAHAKPKTYKTPHNGMALRVIMLFGVLTVVLSLGVFSMQIIYSNDLSINVVHGYGIYQNGVFKDTGDVFQPSPYAIEALNITIANTGSEPINASIILPIDGTIVNSSQELNVNDGNFAKWNGTLLGKEIKTFMVFGRGLSGNIPDTRIEKAPETLQITDNGNISSTSNNQTNQNGNRSYSYTIPKSNPPLIDLGTHGIDLNGKTTLMILGGLAILAIAGGVAFLFGRNDNKDKEKEMKKPRIFMEDIYHNNEDAPAEIRYQEEEYWKKQVYKKNEE